VDDARFLLPGDTNMWLHVATHGLGHAPHYWPRMAADLARLQALPHWGEAQWREVWQAGLSDGCEHMLLLAAAMAGGGRVPSELRRIGAPDAHCALAAARARQAWGIATTAAVPPQRLSATSARGEGSGLPPNHGMADNCSPTSSCRWLLRRED